MTEEYHRPEQITRTEVHALALEAAAAGRAVFPLRGKVPAIAGGRGVKDASTHPQHITAMFNAAPSATGYGIATGAASGIIVVDVDGPEARAEAERRGLRSGYVVRTGRERDGWHLYYALEPGAEVKPRTLAPGLELKAGGSYVVGPGSLHPSGGVYRVVRDGALSPAPAWLLEPGAGARAKCERGQHPRAGRGPINLERSGPPIPEGERNRELARIAGQLHDGSRNLEALTGDLEAVNAARCNPPLELREVERIARSIHTRTPCNPAPAITPRVRAAVDYLASVDRPVKGMGGATGWSVYRAGLAALRELGREHPEGITLSLDVRTWAQRAGTSKAAVSRHLRRSPLMRIIRRGSGKRAATVLFVVPSEALTIGHKVRHSSTRGGSKKNTTPGSVSPDALLRTLERLRWGTGRIGKSRAALLAAVVDCGGQLSRAEIAAKLGRKPASLRAPLRWLVDAGLLERVGHGRYALPPNFDRRLEDAREIGREPEADRLQIARHDRQRDAYRRRNETRAGRAPTEREMPGRPASGTISELERVDAPDPALVEALREYLRRNPRRAVEGPSWLAVALWAGDHVPVKPSPEAVAAALASPALKNLDDHAA